MTPRVVLYTKPGCHLCEAVEQAIEAVRKRRGFEFVKTNIQDDPADYEKYQYEIPVVTVNGVEVGRHRLTAAEFERALGDPDL